jgi:hypothetical protein
MRLAAVLLGATVLTIGMAGTAQPAAPDPTLLFRWADPAIPESSGLAVSSYDDRVVFTHNDSGDPARFFAVDAQSGVTLATYRVPGATNVDWEDMAAAPDESGRPVLWFADIGDNRGRRTSVSLYRVPEPRVDRRRPPAVLTTSPAVRLTLRYPDGPHDAEALLVDARRGSFYVATKSLSGATSVYGAPLRAGRSTELRLVRTLSLGPGSAVTGGAVAPAGDFLVLRTYAEALGWPLGTGGVPIALTGPPRRTPLPASPQGESAAFRSDGSLLVGSEGRHSAVYAVRLGAERPAARPSPTPTPPVSGSGPSARALPAAFGLVAGVFAVAGAWLLRRRRTARRQPGQGTRRRSR